MKIRVRVHAGARLARTEVRGEELHVWVNTPPVDGKANVKVAEVIALLYKLPKSSVRLASGRTSKTKVFDLEGL
ncbi:MAG: DUF167 domain-containing protein [Vicinamibacteria bacterium]|nr:DUF167 domain-containing protein [Vicinamibacteria bacterium]